MRHLDNDEFELLLQGQALASNHVGTCSPCQDRLAEKKALAARLKSAFTGVAPSADLAQRIRNQTILSDVNIHQSIKRHIIRFHSHRRTWAAALSATAAAVLLIPILMITLSPLPAHAALAKIHEHNLSEGREFFSETDPNKLANIFRDKLGFHPRLPQLEHGLQLRGCCVRHFKGDIVGSYVVDTPEGIVSVVIVSDLPQNLDMNPMADMSGPHVFWQGHFSKCNIIATRIHEYTYCAVGETSVDHLHSLLTKLLPASTSAQPN